MMDFEEQRGGKSPMVSGAIILTLAFLLVSCSMPFSSKKTDTDGAKTPTKTDQSGKKSTDKMERIDERAAKPGDIKLIDGIEYIYARNKRYMLTPEEPEYVWVRKDQYSPGIGESLLSGGRKDREEMEKRLAKMEEELKKKGLSAQQVYPAQMMYLPTGMGYAGMMPMVAFNYPSPKMKRRVLVYPLVDQTNYKAEHMGELATRRLVSRLESTGAIIVADPATLNLPASFDQINMRQLNELYGIQAVIRGTLSDVYTSTSKVDGKDDKETSFAMSKLSLEVYNTETGKIIKQLSGRNPVSLSREKGDMSSEKAKMKAIDLTIEVTSEDLLRAILSIDWYARVASIEQAKIYINAGRLSNLAKGDILEAYALGDEKVDSKTNTPLGRVKGAYKGELEVVELFGVDASWAKVRKGTNFAATDFVYLKKD